MEFSKKLVACQWATTLLLIGLVAYGSWEGKDVSALSTMAACSVLGNGAGDALYFWKAKNENRAKYAQRFVRQYAKDYGVEAAIRLAEVVLKD